jgi:two-component system, cell cycle sensor histidine kinase and response regulator CckA
MKITISRRRFNTAKFGEDAMPNAILLVDDHELFRSTLERLLLSAGYMVDTAATGQEAFSRILSRDYSVALLDLKLPDLDGIDIASYLNTEKPLCAVIILTGQASVESAMTAVRLACYDYIPKGRDPQEILQTVRRALESSILRKQVATSTAKYKRLAEASWEGIAFLTTERLLEVNRQFCEMFRIKEQEALLLSLGDFVPGLILESGQGKSDGCRYPPSLQIEAIRSDGELFPAEVHLGCCHENGTAVWVAAIRDLSQHRGAQRAKDKLEQRLTHAMRMESLGLMAGSIAHDLDTILGTITTLPQASPQLAENRLDNRDIDRIRAAGEKAAVVTADLLTIAKGSTSEKKPVNINAVIKEYEESPEFLAFRDRAGRHVEIITDPGIPEIRGVPPHLYKALVNLAENAMEAMDNHGVLRIYSTDRILTDALQAYEVIPPGHYAILGVADTGTGISEEHRPHIFQPFYSHKRGGKGGIGLGLTVVMHTMRDHSGYIDLSSTAAGTAFELYFPVHPSHREAEARINLDSLLGKGEKVLVIDDEEQQRTLAAAILKRLGYTPCLAETGEQAIAYLREHPVDLLLLDLLLKPGMNGYETLKEIRLFNPTQRAVVTSGYHNHPDRERIRNLGVSRYLPKPLSLTPLAIAVQQEMQPISAG